MISLQGVLSQVECQGRRTTRKQFYTTSGDCWHTSGPDSLSLTLDTSNLSDHHEDTLMLLVLIVDFAGVDVVF